MSEQQRNMVINGDGFYVSYNALDIGIYGDITTALVYGQMENFYILNGDHLEEYRKIIDQGWDACLDYFISKIDMINGWSDQPE